MKLSARRAVALLAALALWLGGAAPGAAGDPLDGAERALARGDLEAAVEVFRREAAAATDPARRARALVGLAQVAVLRSEAASALALARDAEALAATAGDAMWRGRARDAQGNAHFFLGETRAALAAFEAARADADRAGDLFGAALARKDAGIAHRVLGEWDDALRDLTEAEGRFRAMGLRDELASALQNQAPLWLAVGLPERALPLYEEAIELGRGANPEVAQGNAIRLGFLHLDLGDPERALARFDEAMAFNRERRVPDDSWTEWGRAAALSALGRDDDAAAARGRALELSLRYGTPAHQASDLAVVARHLLGTDAAAARRMLDRSIALSSSLEEALSWGELFSFARALRLRAGEGDLDRAIGLLGDSVALLEATRRRIPKDDWKRGFVDRHRSVYLERIDALLARAEGGRGGADERRAFETFERAQAAVLRELVDGEGGAAAPPTTPEGIGARLPERGALVAYALLESQVVAFVVEPAAFRVVRLAVTPEELAARVANFVELLVADDREAVDRIGARLATDLVTPVRAALSAGIDRWIVVPDGVLATLPFEALGIGATGSRRFLLEEIQVDYVPSATLFARLPDGDDGGGGGRPLDLLGVAVPDPFVSRRAADGRSSPAALALVRAEADRLPPIPGATREVRTVSDFAGARRLLIGPEATEAEVLRWGTGSSRRARSRRAGSPRSSWCSRPAARRGGASFGAKGSTASPAPSSWPARGAWWRAWATSRIGRPPS